MRTWTVRITAIAQDDFHGILIWTAEQFGTQQAATYAKTLSKAIAALSAGPNIAGAKKRNDIAKELFTLHIARAGRKGRHFLLFRVGADKEATVVEVLRILHDAMDLPLHMQVVGKSE